MSRDKKPKPSSMKPQKDKTIRKEPLWKSCKCDCHVYDEDNFKHCIDCDKPKKEKKEKCWACGRDWTGAGHYCPKCCKRLSKPKKEKKITEGWIKSFDKQFYHSAEEKEHFYVCSSDVGKKCDCQLARIKKFISKTIATERQKERRETIKECCSEVAQYSPISAKHTRALIKKLLII
jgi:hypothetical protein